MWRDMLVKKRALRYNKQQKPDSLKWRHIMVEEGKRTLAYLCPACRQSVAVERSVFQLAASANELPCPCSALRSPSAPAGSVRHPPIPERPACRSAYCAPAPRPAPQREISGGQFWVWERRGLLAAPWWVVFGFPFLAGQCVSRGGGV